METPTKTVGHHGTEEAKVKVLQDRKDQGFPENHQDAVSLTDFLGSMSLALAILGFSRIHRIHTVLNYPVCGICYNNLGRQIRTFQK